MDNRINSHSDNLADIVGMNAILEPASTSLLPIVIVTLMTSILLAILYYQWTHGLTGQLRHIKSQLNKTQLSPRKAAHKIASLVHHQLLSETQTKALEELRFSSQSPTTKQIIEFINHVY